MPRYLSTNQIREMYLSFFESKGHLRYPSHPIPVYDDPTLMFSVAGMAQFKKYFLGAKPDFGSKGEWQRVATAQKCIRIGDIENVGRTSRHCSFFEMLGNFSFDSYFKKEAIDWAWEFITDPKWLGFEPERIFVTVYKDDDEAYKHWTQVIGIPAERINRFDADENFWPQNAPLKGPNGPCGPCSEIFYDRGEAFGSDTWADYAKNPESNRFLEFWNLVFPGYNRTDGPDGKGALEDLGRKNIDTGLGMIRAAAIAQGVPDLYGTDDFVPLIQAVEKLSGKTYDQATGLSHRVIAEHIRMVSMTLADGVNFGTGEREYVVRKVMRRASRHAYLLGLKEPVLYKLVSIVVETLGRAYPELTVAQDSVMKQIQEEEARFLTTLENGIQRIENLLASKKSGDVLEGEDTFLLYDTFGFPLDLTKEIAEERGVSIDEAGYKVALKKAQELARAGSKFANLELFKADSKALEGITATEFLGFETNTAMSGVVTIIKNDERVESAEEGDVVQVVLESTPFYAEGGGQVGDKGALEWGEMGGDGGRAVVTDTHKNAGGVFVHQVRIMRGQLRVNLEIEARVEYGVRVATERHHTATHLLQAALRATLGTHVQQKGSLVTPDRLRFDFTHNQAMTPEEIRRIEALVNRWVQANFSVSYEYMPIEEARKTGAMALFGEKYGDTVRVVSVDGEVSSVGILDTPSRIGSIELCGGTHVERTGQIGAFVIVSEEGVAAGVRRLEALCGEEAVRFVRDSLERVNMAARALNATPETLPERVGKVQDEIKVLNKQIADLKSQLVRAQTSTGSSAETLELGGFKIARLQLAGVSGGDLRTAADDLMDKSQADIVVVGGEGGLAIKASKDAVTRGAHAGQLIGKLAAAGGGKGGGRPDMAQAGVKDAGAALAALETAF